IPSQYLSGRTALERRGALVFQAKQCHNCHALGEKGGKRGPALDRVALRLNEDQLIRQVIQGGGNMPAYGKNLNPPETTALVAFLKTLHPLAIAPAKDASPSAALEYALIPPPPVHYAPWSLPLPPMLALAGIMLLYLRLFHTLPALKIA